MSDRLSQLPNCCANPVHDTGHIIRQSQTCVTCGADWPRTEPELKAHEYQGVGDPCSVAGCGRMPRVLIHQAFFREEDTEPELVPSHDAEQAVINAAIAVSDADLSVYDDVPEAHALMDQLDKAVEAYRGN